MYVDSIKAFKKISPKKEMIVTLEHEINNFNHSLNCLKEAHTSLMDDCCIILDTLAEKVEVVECIEYPILKIKIETLKRQLTYVASLSNTCSSSLTERWKVFKKNPHVTRRNRRSVSSKAIWYYYGDKGNIRPLFMLGTFNFQMG